MVKSETALKLAKLRKRGDATRRAILDVACDEFAKKGFEGASMRAIARTLGTELANIQHHFRDKVGLWNAVLDDVFGAENREAARVYEAYRDGEPDVAIQAMITSIVHHAAANPNFVALMSQARFDPLSREAQGYQLALRDSIRMVTSLIERAQAKGQFVPGRPALLFYHLVGAALRIFTAAADAESIVGKPPTSRDIVEEHLATCLSIFMPHLQQAERMLPPPPVRPESEEEPAKVMRGDLKQRPALLYLIGQVEGLLATRMSGALGPLDLTTAKMIALVRIARGKMPTAARLARLLDVTPQSVMVIVRSLEEQGLITRQKSDSGRRRLLLDITDQGHLILGRLGEIIAEIEHDVFDTIGIEERDDVREALIAVLMKKRPLALSEWTPLMKADVRDL